MAVKMKTPGYTSRDSDLIDWDEVQEVAFLTPHPSTGDSNKPCPRGSSVNILTKSVMMT